MQPARTNPFRVERLHELRFRWPDADVERFLQRFVESNRRGAIVGPHGSGKSTLIEELLPILSNLGHQSSRLRLNEEDRGRTGLKVEQWLAQTPQSSLLILDGAEQLGFWQWRWFLRQAASYSGLLITTHRPGRLPTLLKTGTSVDLFQELVADLLPVGHSLPRELLSCLFHRHRGNVRDCLRELYDRWHEGEFAVADAVHDETTT